MSRIGNLAKPYPEAFAAAMTATMPAGAEPLALFTTIAQSPRAWEKFAGGSLLGRGPLSLRDREIVIDRTTAKTGCEYEWGIHINAFAAKAQLTPEQIASTVNGWAGDGNWADNEAALICAVDSLLVDRKLSNDEHKALAMYYDAAQQLEIVQLVGFYHGVALICGAFDIPLEGGAARFPTKDQTHA